MMFEIARSDVHISLMRLLRSSPQATQEECRVCFYACTSLQQMYKIRAVQYDRQARATYVDYALSVTQKNIRENTGFLTTPLLEELTKLRACCEEGDISAFFQQVLDKTQAGHE